MLDNWSRDSTWRARANLSPSGYVERKVWDVIWEGSRSIVRTWGVRWAQWPTGSLLLLLTQQCPYCFWSPCQWILPWNRMDFAACKAWAEWTSNELTSPSWEIWRRNISDNSFFPPSLAWMTLRLFFLEAWQWNQRCLRQCLLWTGCHNWPSDLAGWPCRWKVTLASANDTLRLDGALIGPLAGGPGREGATA